MRRKSLIRFLALAFIAAVGLGSTRPAAGFIPPAPNYCTDCGPCQTNRDCGVNYGIELGVCSGSSAGGYCHKTYSCACR